MRYTSHMSRQSRRHRAYVRRKARIDNSDDGTITFSALRNIIFDQRAKCAICKEWLPDNFHIDHIIPLVFGGAHTIKNIQFLCPPCNQDKSYRLPSFVSRNRTLLIHRSQPDIGETIYMLRQPYGHEYPEDYWLGMS